ncbi:PAS domain S-box protein [Lysobacter sp. N42]|uniref:PAS domain S-box protein n=1 Tax=Lysobacter sp. N42 TaxID=2545719 RepID=UPI0010E9A7DB|nr:PAS domain S-box protein [Lysobacter sp. N42]TCZ82431.1 PAS domain S-box protein [Lysobacter sp. N42]
MGLAALYLPLALLGMEWSRRQGMGVPVWPAAGLALAALVLRGRALWPGVLAGYLAATVLGPSPPGPAYLLVTSGGVALAAWLGSGLLERVGFQPGLESVRDFLHLMLASALSAVVAASLAGGAFALAGGYGTGATVMLWLRWALGDLNGMLIVGTLLFAWSAGPVPRSARWWWQFAACLALAVVIGAQVFLRGDERLYTFLAYVPLIWAALALRLRGAAVVCLVLAGMGMLGTARGVGPFMHPDPAIRMLGLQTFMLVMASSMLVLAVVADERRAQRALMLSDTRLRLALEATGTGLWKLDLRSGAMTFSPECNRITGLAARDAVGTREGVMRLIHPEDVDGVREAYRRALERQALFEAVFRLCRPDGGEVWLEARGRAVAEGDDRPGTMLGTISDVTGRQRDERRLVDQARLLDLAADAIFIRDLAGRIDYWNRGAEVLYGYTAAEARGRIARELLQSRFPRPFAEIDRELHANDRRDGEIEHTCKDGSRVIVHARWVLNRDAQGRPVSVMQTHTDVTARRRSEATAALLAAIDRDIAGASGVDAMASSGLRRLGEHFGLLRCTLSDIDVEAGQVRTLHEWTQEGAPRVSGVRDAREFFTRDLGRRLAAGEVVAIDDLRTHPLTADFASNYAPYGTVALAATSYVIEGRIAGTLTVACARPHAWRPDELQVLREVVARLWPAIERERSLSALRESEAGFRQMADTAPMMIWMSEPDGSCSYLSRRWCEFTGRMPDDELGFGWVAVIHPDDREEAIARLSDGLRTQEAFSVEYRARRWDGAWRWMHATARPRFGARGEFLGCIGAIMDVTERRDAEDALREADRRKDEFLATLAHELRNPLSPIRTGLQVLNLTDDADVARRTRQMMERQLGHMVRLIDDLLDVSRITSGKAVLQRDRISLQGAARAAIESSRPAIEAARHRLSVDMPAEPLWVDADPTRLAQVLGNLLANAAKSTPDGGDIRLHIDAGEGEARIRVTDTGLGIPREALGEVFGMFAQVNRTLDRAQGGLGIGLALARRLVECTAAASPPRARGWAGVRPSPYACRWPPVRGPPRPPIRPRRRRASAPAFWWSMTMPMPPRALR